jgi:hypothetical protein
MRRIVFALCLSLAAVGNASAADLAFSRGLAQSGFKSLVKESGAVLSFKKTAPAEPLGILGFDLAAEMTAMKLDGDFWDAATADKAPSFLVVPKLRARKGLPLGIDVGLMYAMVPQSNVRLLGFELSEALLDGGMLLPAIGVRATYTRLTGVDMLDLQTAALDATISKGFVVVTPYAGAGVLWIDGKAKGKIQSDAAFLAVNGGPLKEEKIWAPRYFGGLKLSPLPLLGILGEAEYSTVMTYSLKVSLSF